ncbi:MAG TPA: type II toxin-antitoxin system VapC family toxin [Longimicrobiaceae bacterium]|nr:type II toxin-antitoxin system VapC family toxin [Longimicrobiaceae bacterium]
MKYYFLDTSAFVRIYALEPGTETVKDLLRAATAPTPSARVLVCDLVYPEALSALSQRLAEKKLTRLAHRSAADGVRQALHGATTPFLIIPASGVMEQAGELVRIYGLRGADAVHLAAALAGREGAPDGVAFRFVTSDHRQADAARGEGFAVYDPAAKALREPPSS